jgi:hypothetical protein
MSSDMVVALQEASANGHTLFALNQYETEFCRRRICSFPAQTPATGTMICSTWFNVPQARHTYAVLGVQPVGRWGFLHGVNECRVAIGATNWKSRLSPSTPCDAAPELVRLALERSRSAHQAVDVLTDILEHVSQNASDEAPATGDHIFLVADAAEAFVLETTGRYWALMECRHTRAVTDAAMIRQDWRRLAPGLCDCVIARNWCKDDGNKLDFVGCLSDAGSQSRNANKRWGRASLALTQQHGAIDAHFLRRMLGDHYSANRSLIFPQRGHCLANNFLIELSPGDLPILAWVAFGAPHVAVYFPVPMVGDLPEALQEGGHDHATIEGQTRELLAFHSGKDHERGQLAIALERLQTRFDMDAEAFLARSHELAQQGKSFLIPQIASDMMLQHADLFAKEYRQFAGVSTRSPVLVPEEEEVLFFA